MTFILVQVAIFLLLYLVCRSIANRRGHGPQPESDPVKRNDQRDFEMAYRRVEANRQRETARAFRRQQAEIARIEARQNAEIRRIEDELTRRQADDPADREWW